MSSALAKLLLSIALALAGQPAEQTGERITFVLPLSEAQGGGEVRGSADAMEYVRESAAVLSGAVELFYEDLEVRAERVELDLQAKQVTAQGNVILDQGPRRLSGATLVFDLEAKTGVLTEATAAVSADYYFSGAEIAKIGDDLYTVKDGVFTSCEGEVPAWSFSIGEARIREDAYARVHHATMRAKSLPVAYWPYLVWPTKSDRSSGLLLPNLGYSDRRGSYLGLAYYQVLGPSYDATLNVDLFSEDFFGLGTELRYHPTPGTEGNLRGYAIQDPLQDEVRWKVLWHHQSRNLPGGLRGVFRVEDYSDFEFFRDFERDLERKSNINLYSSGFLSGNWGAQSFNVLVDQRETFLGSGRVITLRQLPEVEYKLRPTQLGKLPLFVDLDSSVHYLSVDRSETYAGEYPRADLFPQMAVPLTTWPWLSASIKGGVRVTWYGDSIGVDEQGATTFVGEQVTRVLPVASAEVVGPSFSRVFDKQKGFFGKYKHVVEPRFQYSFVDDFEDQDALPLFDQIDGVRGLHQGRVAFINRLLAKPRDSKGGGSREILSLELARRYSLDPERFLEQGTLVETLGDGTVTQHSKTSTSGPLEATLRSYPGDRFGLRLDASYSLLFDQLTAVRLSTLYGAGPYRLALSWAPRFRNTTGETLSNQATMGLSTLIVPRRLTLTSNLSYDFERQLLRDQRHHLVYTGSCFTFRLEYHQSDTGSALRRDWVFSLDLKNVGTFLDFNGGESESF